MLFSGNIKLGNRSANPGVVGPPSLSLPTLLLGLICTHLPRRLLTDLPCPWQGFDREGGVGARREWMGGASHGEGGGERDRPTGAWLAKSSSDLEKALMCTDGAGWEQNQLGWRRTCSARDWFGAGCVRGSGLAPCSLLCPWGGGRSGGVRGGRGRLEVRIPL